MPMANITANKLNINNSLNITKPDALFGWKECRFVQGYAYKRYII